MSNGEKWVSMSPADTVSVKERDTGRSTLVFQTAVVFSHRRLGILGLDESSDARPGETASAWGAQAVGVATVLPISVFFGLTHRREGQHFLRRRNSHSFFSLSFATTSCFFRCHDLLFPRQPVAEVPDLKFLHDFMFWNSTKKAKKCIKK